MKINIILVLGMGMVLLGSAICSTGRAQGMLTPLGAPAPTMKTLSQIHSAVVAVEPRTALSISTTPGMSNYFYAITNSGSYFLSENTTVTNGGILVNADDVTIDLGGFILEGNPSVFQFGIHGICFPGRSNVEIRNGTVARFSDSGLASGDATTGTGIRIADLRVLQNVQYGMKISAYGTDIHHCLVASNGAYGIESQKETIIHNTACIGNGQSGIYVGKGSVVTGIVSLKNGENGISTSGNSVIQHNTTQNNEWYGINAGPYCLVQENVVSGNGYSGIRVTYGSQVRDNVLTGNNTNVVSSAAGIFMQTGSHAIGNTLYSNSMQGIYASGSNCVIEGNAISGSLTGITFQAIGSLYVNNRFGGLVPDVGGTATDGGGNIRF